MGDPNVEAVIARLQKRAERGLEKYGTDTTRDDLSHVDWLRHLQDELLDGAVYCERLIALSGPGAFPEHGEYGGGLVRVVAHHEDGTEITQTPAPAAMSLDELPEIG